MRKKKDKNKTKLIALLCICSSITHATIVRNEEWEKVGKLFVFLKLNMLAI